MRSLYLRFNFSSTPIGFIGVGKMGQGMIQNLAKTKRVLAYDADPNFMRNLKNPTNITQMDSLRSMMKMTDTFILMLPNEKICRDVCQNEDGIFKNSGKDSLIIDCSTISPYAAIDLNRVGETVNMTYVDAPVSGGIGGAAAGTITLMVGSQNERIFERCRLILSLMGNNIFNCLKPGNGQVSKICNNMALGIQMVATSEALNLGKKMGMDSKLLTSIMKVSSSRSWCVDPYNPVPGVNPDMPASREYEGGFATELMLKDLSIAVEIARKSNSQTPLGDRTKDIYTELNKQGLGRKDFSIIYQKLSENKVF